MRVKNSMSEQISRRDFLKTFSALAAVGVEKTIFSEASGSEKRDRQNVEFTPDYKKHLDRMLFTLESCDETGRLQEFHTIYDGLLNSLPSYTVYEVIGRQADVNAFKRVLKDLGLERQVVPHIVADTVVVNRWAQDTSKPIKKDGQDIAWTSLPLSPKVRDMIKFNGFARYTEDRSAPVTGALRGRAVQAPFVFEGGNLMFDVVDGRQTVFLGSMDWVYTVQTYLENIKSSPDNSLMQLFLQEVPEAAIANDFSSAGQSIKNFLEKHLGAKIVVMGKENIYQFGGFFHLDQSIVLLDKRQAIVASFGEEPAITSIGRRIDDCRKRHDEYAQQLTTLGYTVKRLPHTMKDTTHRFSSLNGIPFVDRRDNKNKMIFPVFPGEYVEGVPANKPLNLDNLAGKARRTYAIFEECGYVPVPVLDTQASKSGSLHCISNLVALNDRFRSKEFPV